jgi:hypothetical protein
VTDRHSIFDLRTIATAVDGNIPLCAQLIADEGVRQSFRELIQGQYNLFLVNPEVQMSLMELKTWGSVDIQYRNRVVGQFPCILICQSTNPL